MKNVSYLKPSYVLLMIVVVVLTVIISCSDTSEKEPQDDTHHQLTPKTASIPKITSPKETFPQPSNRTNDRLNALKANVSRLSALVTDARSTVTLKKIAWDEFRSNSNQVRTLQAMISDSYNLQGELKARMLNAATSKAKQEKAAAAIDYFHQHNDIESFPSSLDEAKRQLDKNHHYNFRRRLPHQDHSETSRFEWAKLVQELEELTKDFNSNRSKHSADLRQIESLKSRLNTSDRHLANELQKLPNFLSSLPDTKHNHLTLAEQWLKRSQSAKRDLNDAQWHLQHLRLKLKAAQQLLINTQEGLAVVTRQ